MSIKHNNRIIKLKELGWAEMLIALMPILCPYYLGSLPITFYISLLLSVISIYKKKQINYSIIRPFVIFFVYWFVHELVLLVVADSFNINRRISQLVSLLFVILVVPMLDLRKLTNSLNVVSLISIIGLLFQLVTVLGGGMVHPIEIPGLSMSVERLEELSNRPSSFFMEPAAFAIYMYAPLALSLINGKYWWSTIIALAMFLSTSTTALFSAFIILGVYVFSQGMFSRRSLFIVVLSLIMLYGLNNLSIFEVGMNKYQNTDFDTNIRISQGPIVVKTMNVAEVIFGVPYGDSGDYFKAGRTMGVNVITLGEQIYMSTFWNLIFSYGLVGLILYISIFYRIAKYSRVTIPFIVCYFVTMFTASINLSMSFIFSLIILYVIATQYKPIDKSRRLLIN